MPPLFPDPELFRPAIEAAGREGPLPQQITGMIVPHHLLAIRLIARTFRLAGGHGVRRIIVLAPDHFRRSRRPFSVCARDLDSCLGRVPAARGAALALARHSLVEVSNLFSQDHAVQALLPFLAHHFPGTPVLAVAVHTLARPADWRRLATLLEPLTGPGTLVIQSTDFSHGLTWEQARGKDQKSLWVLASEDAEQVPRLHQPANIDCRGALFLQLVFQKARAAHPLLIDHRNSQEFSPGPLTNTTSYISALYSPEFAPPEAGSPGTRKISP